jgi:DNA-directed RNA polymerase subunit RPC12/RpoP
MPRTLYKCARCGKRITQGNEKFLGKSAYGVKCYELMKQKQIEFDLMVMRKAKHG